MNKTRALFYIISVIFCVSCTDKNEQTKIHTNSYQHGVNVTLEPGSSFWLAKYYIIEQDTCLFNDLSSVENAGMKHLVLWTGKNKLAFANFFPEFVEFSGYVDGASFYIDSFESDKFFEVTFDSDTNYEKTKQLTSEVFVKSKTMEIIFEKLSPSNIEALEFIDGLECMEALNSFTYKVNYNKNELLNPNNWK